MTYKPPISIEGVASVFVHNKDELSPNNAFIIGHSTQPEISLEQFLSTASTEDLRTIFSRAAQPLGSPVKKPFILFHAFNPDSACNDTNSQLEKLHIHSFTAPFAKAFKHIDMEKSWVHTPNEDLEKCLNRKFKANSSLSMLSYVLPEDEKEAQSHRIIMFPQYKNLADFALHAGDRDLETFREQLLLAIKDPLHNERMGGARIVINEHMGTKCLTIQILSGENLDRTGQGLRYFQNPVIKPSTP